ncbi:hypothetical protein [Motilibacter rhizosphaerae]|nr:hypothetical protein [Motilibacter rhizosphaerae]
MTDATSPGTTPTGSTSSPGLPAARRAALLDAATTGYLDALVGRPVPTAPLRRVLLLDLSAVGPGWLPDLVAGAGRVDVAYAAGPLLGHPSVRGWARRHGVRLLPGDPAEGLLAAAWREHAAHPQVELLICSLDEAFTLLPDAYVLLAPRGERPAPGLLAGASAVAGVPDGPRLALVRPA